MTKDKMIPYRIAKTILGFIFRLYYNPKIENKENIPTEGPIIIAGNHKHLYDQCLVILATKRPIHYMAKREYFDGKFAWFFKSTGCISVDRSKKDDTAVKKAMNVLKNGYALGIFPEGTRNRTKEPLLPFKYGAVSMAKKANALIVPFAITGEYKFRSKNLKITFGKPQKVGEDLEKSNEKLQKTVLKLMQKSVKN